MGKKGEEKGGEELQMAMKELRLKPRQSVWDVLVAVHILTAMLTSNYVLLHRRENVVIVLLGLAYVTPCGTLHLSTFCCEW